MYKRETRATSLCPPRPLAGYPATWLAFFDGLVEWLVVSSEGWGEGNGHGESLFIIWEGDLP